jgi:hypothetical protein
MPVKKLRNTTKHTLRKSKPKHTLRQSQSQRVIVNIHPPAKRRRSSKPKPRIKSRFQPERRGFHTLLSAPANPSQPLRDIAEAIRLFQQSAYPPIVSNVRPVQQNRRSLREIARDAGSEFITPTQSLEEMKAREEDQEDDFRREMLERELDHQQRRHISSASSALMTPVSEETDSDRHAGSMFTMGSVRSTLR